MSDTRAVHERFNHVERGERGVDNDARLDVPVAAMRPKQVPATKAEKRKASGRRKRTR